jgi:hypothetical protein
MAWFLDLGWPDAKTKVSLLSDAWAARIEEFHGCGCGVVVVRLCPDYPRASTGCDNLRRSYTRIERNAPDNPASGRHCYANSDGHGIADDYRDPAAFKHRHAAVHAHGSVRADIEDRSCIGDLRLAGTVTD